jgi:hypothetical protein
MKRRMMVGLFAGSLLLLLQGHRSVSAQQQTQKEYSSAAQQWETVENIPVLRVWKISPHPPGKEVYPQIALAEVSDSDFQKFVQDPKLLKAFVNTNHIFDAPIKTAGPWASLMTTNDGGDPPNWLLTFSHSRTSNMAITSQPLVPETPNPPPH